MNYYVNVKDEMTLRNFMISINGRFESEQNFEETAVKEIMDTATDRKMNKDDDTEKKLGIIKEIAHDSMQQEKDRAELIQSKSQSLIRYISATIGGVNAILVFLLDGELINTCQLFWLVAFIDVPFVISLFLAVAAQIMMKALYYPSGIQVLDDMEKSNKRNLTVLDYEVYQLKCKSIYVDSLWKVNNIRAKYIKWSYVCYLLGLVMIIVQAVIILT